MGYAILKQRKKIASALVFFVLFIFCISFFAFTAYAQPVEYVPLSPVPGLTEGETGGKTPESYLENAFAFGIGLAGLLAVIMLIICGFKYVTTESFSGKGDAKSCIWASIGGLILVFGSWLILNTINPALLQFDFSKIRDFTPIERECVGEVDPVSGECIGEARAPGEKESESIVVTPPKETSPGSKEYYIGINKTSCPKTLSYDEIMYSHWGSGIVSQCGNNNDIILCCRYRVSQP